MKEFLKLIVAVAILSLSAACKQNSHIKIEGTVDSLNGASVRIESENYLTVYDSAIVKNGHFKFNTKLPKDGFYWLFVLAKTPEGVSGTQFQIYVQNNALYKFKGTGFNSLLKHHYYTMISTSHAENKLFQVEKLWIQKEDSLVVVKQKIDKLFEKNLSDTYYTNRYADSSKLLEKQVGDAKEAAILQFVQSDGTSVITPYFITQTATLFDNYDKFKNALAKVSPEVKRSAYYGQAARLLKSVQHISKGGKAPALFGKDIDGRPLGDAYKKNKLILLSFWASYCIPCREEAPDLKKIYAKYKNKGFEIVSISIDESKDNWKGALEKDQLPWLNISECVPAEKSKNVENYVIKGVPASYLINGEGKILYKDLWLDKLDMVLGKELF